jgi:hypothetical protein
MGAAPAQAGGQAAGPVPGTGQAKTPERDDDPSKFFWFNKAGADPTVVRTDIEYCIAQTSGMAGRVQQNAGAGAGLIGALVGGIINGITQGVETRRMRDAGLRKCMSLYGYARYRVAEPAWNELMRGDGALDRLVAFATGPVPATERLDA